MNIYLKESEVKVIFEPKLGLEVTIVEDGDFCLSQESSKIFVSIGQMRGLMKKMPDLLKLADEKRSMHLSKSEVV